MMSVKRLAALFFLAALPISPSFAADKPPYVCKKDPTVVEPCRWVKGHIFFGAQLRSYFAIKGEKQIYILKENYSSLFASAGMTEVGEFEFCRLADTTIYIPDGVDAPMAALKEPFGCINAVGIIIYDPDEKTLCDYAGCETETKP